MEKELIGYSHNGMKFKLSELTPVYKKGLEVGKWYRKPNSIAFYQGDEVETYGINFTCLDGWIVSRNWFAGWNETLRNNTLATDKEVEEALIKEAKKRGFKEGVKINRNGIGFYQGTHNSLILSDIDSASFSKGCLTLKSDSYTTCIFKDGAWATIAKNETNKVKLNSDYTAEIKDGFVQVGCQEIPFSAIKELHKAIKKLQ